MLFPLVVVAGLACGPAAAQSICTAGSAFSGGTLTSGVTFSGVTTDITAASGEDVTILGGASTGSVVIQSPDDLTTFTDSAGGNELFIRTTTGFTGIPILAAYSSGGAAMRLDSTAAQAGLTTAAAANAAVFCAGDSIAHATKTDLVCMYGSGAIGVPTTGQQAITIADSGGGGAATDSTSPSSSHIEITCNDADGCTWTPGETTVVDGWTVTAINVSAANVVTIADSAGVVRARGGSIAMSASDSVTCSYTGSIWSCR